jgi:hypothetical protein
MELAWLDLQAKNHRIVNTVKKEHIQKALREPVISIHVKHQQGPNDLFHHAAINSKVIVYHHSFLRHPAVEASRAARQGVSLEVEVDVKERIILVSQRILRHVILQVRHLSKGLTT